MIAPHGSTLNWFDVGTRTESFDQEPNNDREQAQPIEFPVLINGIVENEDYDYFRFEARAGQTIAFDGRVLAQRRKVPIRSVAVFGVDMDFVGTKHEA